MQGDFYNVLDSRSRNTLFFTVWFFGSNFPVVFNIQIKSYFIFIYLYDFIALCNLIFSFQLHEARSNRLKFAVVKIIGRVYTLKLILYGTREDPLLNNKHVERRKKRVAKFTKVQIANRRKGELKNNEVVWQTQVIERQT